MCNMSMETDCKDEPMLEEMPRPPTPPPRFESPSDALKFYSRLSKYPFPIGITFTKENDRYVSKLLFNNLLYEAEGWNEISAQQKLALYILYGEFDQDATDLFNYFVKKATGTLNYKTDAEEVRKFVELLRAKSAQKVAMISPLRPEDDISPQPRPVSALEHSRSGESSEGANGKREHSNDLVSVESKRPRVALYQYSEDHASNNNKIAELEAETAQLRNKIVLESQIKVDLKTKKQKENFELMLKLERCFLNQLLCFSSFGKIEDLPAKELELKKFINEVGKLTFQNQEVSFPNHPIGFAPFYAMVKVNPNVKTDRCQLMFAGKGNSSKEALVNALLVVEDFIKRSCAFNDKLLGPNEDVLERLHRVLKYPSVDKIPLKISTNKLFGLHEASLFHQGQNYKSVYSRTVDEAKRDVAMKVLRSKDYTLYNDAINLRLTV